MKEENQHLGINTLLGQEFLVKCHVIADAGRDWGQEEKGTTEDEMAGWHQ